MQKKKEKKRKEKRKKEKKMQSHFLPQGQRWNYLSAG